ncbi:hypothetical protein [Bacillus sp. UNC322MFChir4.1]|uniref:hypothetical protein n=1 Tax=Bacillus sp. UNC322MFChir4.1 TaxID=1449045 RepID=UPI000555BB83|nr:hypothetical protein [Bacillus sp. UNC322MFChir4.1]
MPKVKMKTSLAASDFSYVPGDIVEVNEEVAIAWQEHGLAELYEEKVSVIEHKQAEQPKSSRVKKKKQDSDE